MAFHQITDPERLHALIDAIMLIEIDDDLDDLLGTIVEAATQLVGARYGALGIVSKNGRTLSRFITYGIEPEVKAAIGDDPHGHGVLGETIRRRDPLRIDDLASYANFGGFPENHPPMNSFLGVPVITQDGQVFGNLYLSERIDGERFNEQDENLVEAFGRAAGLVIDQATMRSQLRDLTLSEERERLARDLHDTVIQRLFGVGLALQMSLSRSMDDDARTRVNNAIDELDTTIHEIRTTIFEIDQDGVEGGSFSSRIKVLVEEMDTRLGVHVNLETGAAIDDLIGPHCAQQALQALREALSNVARHAGANNAEVSVVAEGPLIVVVVRDSGVGFEGRIGPGRGLRNLIARARQLGGECTIDSAPGRGTLVRWTANRLD